MIGIIISPYFHKLSSKDRGILNYPNYVIVEVQNSDTEKDSAGVLKAGANRLFFLQVHDKHLKVAIKELKKYTI
jgi:hypothetical protein